MHERRVATVTGRWKSDKRLLKRAPRSAGDIFCGVLTGLTQEQVATFVRDGFVRVENAFPPRGSRRGPSSSLGRNGSVPG